MDFLIFLLVVVAILHIYFTLKIRAAMKVAEISRVNVKSGMILISNFSSFFGVAIKILYWVLLIAVFAITEDPTVSVAVSISSYLIKILIPPTTYQLLFSSAFIRTAERHKYTNPDNMAFSLWMLRNAGYISPRFYNESASIDVDSYMNNNHIINSDYRISNSKSCTKEKVSNDNEFSILNVFISMLFIASIIVIIYFSSITDMPNSPNHSNNNMPNYSAQRNNINPQNTPSIYRQYNGDSNFSDSNYSTDTNNSTTDLSIESREQYINNEDNNLADSKDFQIVEYTNVYSCSPIYSRPTRPGQEDERYRLSSSCSVDSVGLVRKEFGIFFYVVQGSVHGYMHQVYFKDQGIYDKY